MKAGCYGKNKEIVDRIFPGKFPLEERQKMEFKKEEQSQKGFRSFLKYKICPNSFWCFALQKDLCSKF